MKKRILNVFFGLSIVFCLLSLCGCSKKEENKLSPEESAKQTVQAFYDNYYSNNIERAINLIDFAGMEVYNEQDGELDNFKEIYNLYINSDEWKEYKLQIESSWKNIAESLKSSSENIQMPKIELSNIKVETVSEDVYRVIADIKETNNSGEIIESGEFEHYVFKDNNGDYKIIYAEE